MALKGIWQMKKLLVMYCDHQGGSRSTREFIEKFLPQFKAKNPQIEIETEVHRGHDPYVKGFYLSKRDRVVGTRKFTSEQIKVQVERLRNSTGRKVIKLKTRHVTKTPSIQGTWTPFMKIE